MSHYRKIDTRINNDAKFRSLKPLEQWLWYRLITHDHLTSLGAMRNTPGGLAEDLEMPKKQFARLFRSLIETHFVCYDEKTHLMWFRNFLKYDGPANPNVIKGWNEILDKLPEGNELNKLIQHVAIFVCENFSEAFVEALPKAFMEALPKPFRKGLPKQEQEQKQEQNNNIILTPVITSAHDEIEIIANAENKKMFELPTKKGDNFPIFESDLTIFKNNYPAIDVKNELEKMKLWLTDKQFPKNYFSMRQFVNAWLSKAQHESENIRNFEKNGVKHYAKTGAINTKQPSAFEQAMSPGVQWAAAE
jgi:hypothetical protein